MRSASFPAVTCPGIEAQLSEHVTWRLVSGALNEFGAQVVLSCSPGYFLEGSRLVQCQADGTWSSGEERPRCRGEYGGPPPAPHPREAAPPPPITHQCGASCGFPGGGGGGASLSMTMKNTHPIRHSKGVKLLDYMLNAVFSWLVIVFYKL